MKRTISWIKECDGHFCDTVSMAALIVIVGYTMFFTISQLL
mgnify:CR=1 FL=1|jgi:hypothetical protein